jgi:hypothetical protein
VASSIAAFDLAPVTTTTSMSDWSVSSATPDCAAQSMTGLSDNRKNSLSIVFRCTAKLHPDFQGGTIHSVTAPVDVTD